VRSAGVRVISPNRSLSSEDLIRICRALDEQRIDYQQDDHCIKVAGDQYDRATTVVAKLDLGQHPIVELRDRGSVWQFLWETPEERKIKEQLTREKILESLISRLDGVVWSLVSIHHVHPSPGVRTAPKPSAFVYIESVGDRQLPPQTIQSISVILTGFERELSLNSITVMDRRGHIYLDSASPALSDASRTRAKEEELTQTILCSLHWINGVRVFVQLGKRPPSQTAPSRVPFKAAAAQPNLEHHQQKHRAGEQLSEKLSGTPLPTIRINQPLLLDVESSPTRVVDSAGATVLETPTGLGADRSTRCEFRHADHAREHGQVLVDVPRSFYRSALINRSSQRTPSPEDEDVLASRTNEQIKRTIRAIVPDPTMWDVYVDTIPDDVSLSRPLRSSQSAERGVVDPRRVATIGAGFSLVLATAAVWFRVARRVWRGPEFAHRNCLPPTDSGTGTGRLERVQEIIRLDPEAAASVLQRWTEQ
jgi:hypothetical protein